MIELKSAREIGLMRRRGHILAEVMERLRDFVKPGMSTLEIDEDVEAFIRSHGALPAFKGYRGFPATLCASINQEVVHGIPSPKRALREGDIISLDVGAKLDGFYGDSAVTVPVGTVPETTKRLLRITREALDRGINQARAGARLSDVSHAIQQWVEAHGYSVVREFVGHGIGSQLHEEPQIPNFGAPGRRERLVPGMVLAIEPMVNAGKPDVLLSAEDGWTARTRDGSLSAHFEVCVAVTENGPRVLGVPEARS